LFTCADYIAKGYEIMTNITGKASLIKVIYLSTKKIENIPDA